MNRYLAIILAVLYGAELQAQQIQPVPKLVVNVTIDQLRSDYLKLYTPLYANSGFKKLMQQGAFCSNLQFPFIPVERASAIASIVTGATPFYHNIIANQWLDRATLRPISSTDDSKFLASPQRLYTSTLGDELKIATNGTSLVYAVATQRDAAVLAAGHAADGAFWIDERTGVLTSSLYYPDKAAIWLNAFKATNSASAVTTAAQNALIVKAALECIKGNNMGKDGVTDFLSVALDVPATADEETALQLQYKYLQLDDLVSTLITGIETSVGKDNVLFVVSGTGTTPSIKVDFAKYKIPTGVFYLNRTGNLLNIFLSAVYGQGRYVEACFGNQIYFNRKLIEQKRIDYADLLKKSETFLLQNAGVANVFTVEHIMSGSDEMRLIKNGYHVNTNGDILIQVQPGWQIKNEDTQEHYAPTVGYIPVPLVFYGAYIKAGQLPEGISVEQIAATIAKAIRIRAPNACRAIPLF